MLCQGCTRRDGERLAASPLNGRVAFCIRKLIARIPPRFYDVIFDALMILAFAVQFEIWWVLARWLFAG